MAVLFQSLGPQQLFALGGLAIAFFVLYMTARPKPRRPSPLKLSQTDTKSNRQADQVKQLNVIFQYNGHDFDAYQVLGVPAGSNLETVRKAYEKGLQMAEAESHEFLKTAYQAIVRK